MGFLDTIVYLHFYYISCDIFDTCIIWYSLELRHVNQNSKINWEWKILSELELLPLHKLGAREDKRNFGVINFGLFLPGISKKWGNKLLVKVIHEKDQFLQDIPPMSFEMEHSEDLDYGDYWSTTINIESKNKPKPDSAWGTPGKYVYRYCLEIPKRGPIDWIIDPFAREFGVGKLSAFSLGYKHYKWNEHELVWKTPSINDIVLYELMINEFAADI